MGHKHRCNPKPIQFLSHIYQCGCGRYFKEDKYREFLQKERYKVLLILPLKYNFVTQFWFRKTSLPFAPFKGLFLFDEDDKWIIESVSYDLNTGKIRCYLFEEVGSEEKFEKYINKGWIRKE